MSAPLRVGPQLVTVPQNRWDLVPHPEHTPRVSVIVPYFEQQEQLERLLVGLELQDPDAGVVDVVVADDGSSTPPVVPRWYRGPPVSVVRQPDRGVRPGAARNLGVRHATGDVLAFLDADMVPSPGCIRELARLPAVAPEAVVVGARRHRDLRGWTPAAVRSWLRDGPEPPRFDDPRWLADGYVRSRDLLDLDRRSYQFVISAVMAMSRSLFVELAGFDETIVDYGGEDWDLAYRCQNAGAVLAHVPAVAYHDGPDWRQRSGADATNNPERCNLIQRIPGRHDPIIGCPLAVVTMDARGHDPATIVACVASVLGSAASAAAVILEDPPVVARAVLRHDSRVHVGEAQPDHLDRSLLTIRLLAPIAVSATTFDALLALADPGGPGRATVIDDRELSSTSSRGGSSGGCTDGPITSRRTPWWTVCSVLR